MIKFQQGSSAYDKNLSFGAAVLCMILTVFNFDVRCDAHTLTLDRSQRE